MNAYFAERSWRSCALGLLSVFAGQISRHLAGGAHGLVRNERAVRAPEAADVLTAKRTPALPAAPQSSMQFDIPRGVVADGGGTSADANYKVEGTIGQPAAGTTMGNGQFAQTGGFWAEKQGAEFGKRTDQQGCQDEALRRLRAALRNHDLLKRRETQLFMYGCFQSCQATSNFCLGAPKEDAFFAVRKWSQEQCQQQGLGDDDACVSVFMEVSDACLGKTKRREN